MKPIDADKCEFYAEKTEMDKWIQKMMEGKEE